MDSGEYLNIVKEQLRAYDFQEREVAEFDHPLFEKRDQGLISDKSRTIIIKEVPESTVESVKNSAVFVKENVVQNNSTIFNEDASTFQFYAIFIPPKSTKAMEIAVERAAKNQNSGSNWFLLPMLVDLDNETLAYQDPSLFSHNQHHEMVNNIDKYFRV